MIIRKALHSDLEDIIKLDNNVLTTKWTSSMYEGYISKADSLFYTMYEGSVLLGFILVNKGLDQSDILQVAMNPSFQSKGFGSRLLIHILSELPKDHEILLEVEETNTQAINFYKKMGFEFLSIRKFYYSNGHHAHVYRKVI